MPNALRGSYSPEAGAGVPGFTIGPLGWLLARLAAKHPKPACEPFEGALALLGEGRLSHADELICHPQKIIDGVVSELSSSKIKAGLWCQNCTGRAI